MTKMIDETGIEYKLFFDTFLWVKISGFWRPTTIKKRWMKRLYGFYTVIAYINMGLMIIQPLSYIATSKESFTDAFASNWFLPAIVSHTLYVGTNVKMKRKKILNLIRTKVMSERWTNLRDPVEEQIINASHQSEQNVFRYWMYIIFLNGFMNAINPITTDNPDKDLIFSTWKWCDTHAASCFWPIWISQALSYTTASIIHVAGNCIALDLIERVCSHCRILQHRLSLMPHLVSTGMLDTAEKEKSYLVECILDHQNIYSTAKQISDLFSTVVTLYFMLNFSILCTSIYLLSKQPLFSNKFIAACLFLCCMLVQGLLQCWCGYKLTQINDDISYTIFSMNWLKLRKDARKTLCFIMLSVSKSIPLFDNFIVELSPEMFLRIIKVSYSAYNLLKTRK